LLWNRRYTFASRNNFYGFLWFKLKIENIAKSSYGWLRVMWFHSNYKYRPRNAQLDFSILKMSTNIKIQAREFNLCALRRIFLILNTVSSWLSKMLCRERSNISVHILSYVFVGTCTCKLSTDSIWYIYEAWALLEKKSLLRDLDHASLRLTARSVLQASKVVELFDVSI